MAERNPPIWMQSGSYDAVDDRMITGLMSDRDFDASGNFAGVAGGVVPPADQLRVTGSGSGMAIYVSSGAVVIPAQGSNPPGAYICYSDGLTTKTLDVAVNNPRIDSIYCKVSDQAVGDDVSRWSIEIAKGSESSSPTPPPLDRTRIKLADVRVLPAAQNGGVNKITTAQVSDLRRFYAAQGGMHLNFGGGAPLPAAVPGRMLYITDKKSLYVSDGTSFEPIYTYREWMSYMRSLKPRQVIRGGSGDLSTKRTWTPYLTGALNTSVRIDYVRCPAGYAKVNLSGFSKVSDVAGTNQSHCSVRVTDSATGATRFAPAIIYGFSSYDPAWQRRGVSFMVDGLPTDQDLTFQVEYYRDSTGPATQRGNYAEICLMVEPGF